MLTYERTDDYVLTLSDAGQQRLADEQRADQTTKAKTAIFCGTATGFVVAGATWMICKILGG
ncbi:MAG TPA: hypothetical protein VF534_17840 [Paraburkholderia sp.]